MTKKRPIAPAKRDIDFKIGASPEQLVKFKALAQSGFDIEQAAKACWIAPRWAAKHLTREYADALTELRLECMQALKGHIKDNAPAAIFAAKAKLGWQDVTKIEQTNTVDFIDVPQQETRAQWEARQAKLRLVKSSG